MIADHHVTFSGRVFGWQVGRRRRGEERLRGVGNFLARKRDLFFLAATVTAGWTGGPKTATRSGHTRDPPHAIIEPGHCSTSLVLYYAPLNDTRHPLASLWVIIL
jgi:hypothetical protein